MDQVTNTLWTIEADGISQQVVDEMLRQAEMRQASMFTASVGMDQRAAVMGAGLIAAAGALAAAGFAVSGPQAEQLRHAALAMAGAIAIGALCCIYACRPQISRFPGIEPMDWAYDPQYLKHNVVVLKLARVAKIQDEILENETKQQLNGRAITAGLLIAALGPLIGAIFAWS